MMRWLMAGLGGWVFWVGGVCAQEGEGKVLVHLISWGEDIPGLYLGKSGAKGNQVTALAFRYSKPLEHRGGGMVAIARDSQATLEVLTEERDERGRTGAERVRAVKEAVVEGEVPKVIREGRKENPDLVALASLPAGSKEVAVLLSPGPGGTYRTFVLDQDVDKLPPGKVRVQNFCEFPVAIKVSGAAKPVEYGSWKSGWLEPKNGRVVYQLAYKVGDQWKVQENNMYLVREREQVQMIVLKSDASFFSSGDGTTGGFVQTLILRKPID